MGLVAVVHSVVGVAGSLAPVGGVLITVSAGLSVGPSPGPSFGATATVSSCGKVNILLVLVVVSIAGCHSSVVSAGGAAAAHVPGPAT